MQLVRDVIPSPLWWNYRTPNLQTGIHILQMPKLGASTHKALLSQAMPMFGSNVNSSFLISLPLPLLAQMGFGANLIQSRRCSLQAPPSSALFAQELIPWPMPMLATASSTKDARAYFPLPADEAWLSSPGELQVCVDLFWLQDEVLKPDSSQSCCFALDFEKISLVNRRWGQSCSRQLCAQMDSRRDCTLCCRRIQASATMLKRRFLGRRCDWLRQLRYRSLSMRSQIHAPSCRQLGQAQWKHMHGLCVLCEKGVA